MPHLLTSIGIIAAIILLTTAWWAMGWSQDPMLAAAIVLAFCAGGICSGCTATADALRREAQALLEYDYEEDVGA